MISPCAQLLLQSLHDSHAMGSCVFCLPEEAIPAHNAVLGSLTWNGDEVCVHRVWGESGVGGNPKHSRGTRERIRESLPQLQEQLLPSQDREGKLSHAAPSAAGSGHVPRDPPVSSSCISMPDSLVSLGPHSALPQHLPSSSNCQGRLRS